MQLSELTQNKLFLSVAAGLALTGFFGGAIYFENESITEVRGQIESRKLYEIVDLIDRGSEASHYLVWLGKLQVSQVSDPKRDQYGNFRADGFSGSGNFANLANFLQDLEESSFANGFNSPAPPEG